MTREWDNGNVWLKSTDKDGGVSYTEHRCWDAGRFIQATHEAAIKAGGSVEQITQEDYAKATHR